MSNPDNSEARKAWILFAAAIVFWGANWPIMKIGLAYTGPLWFAALRVSVAVVCLFALLAAQGRLSLPKRKELPVLFSVGVLQVGGFMGLIHFSLLFVEAGRSSVLAYTTPIWVAPLAAWFLGERLTRQKLIGLLIGVGGLMVLFNPLTFPWGWNGYTLGNVLLILAAVLWAGVIVHVRGYGWTRPHLSLLPWQFLLGGIVLVVTAYAVEGPPDIPMSVEFAAIMAFNGVLATAFSFWAFIQAARTLPASTVAMGSLGVPVVGIASSVLVLGEQVSDVMALGAGMILLGVAVFTKRSTPSAQ